MKILLIHQAFQSADGAGGTRHFEFAKHLVSEGHEITVVASDVSYMNAAKFAKDKRREQIEGIQIVRASTPQFIHRGYVWRSLAFVCYMISSFWAGLREPNVDVVMGTSPSLFQALSASFVAFFKRKPFLLEIRDLWPEFAIEMGILQSRPLIWMARLVESFIYWRATHFLVNSPAYVDYLVKRGISKSSVTLIPNGVDITMFGQLDGGGSIRTEFGLEDKFVVTYAGAIGPANDIQTIVRAANLVKENSEIHFLLIGGGKAASEVETLITELGLENVTMGGTKPKSEMCHVLDASDVCVATLLKIPMFQTVYPNKIFDYMAAGKPIILGIDGVIREVVDSAKGGVFVDPGSDRELAEAVTWTLTHQDEAAEMGRRGREYVTKHFNRDAHSREFLELTLSLC